MATPKTDKPQARVNREAFPDVYLEFCAAALQGMLAGVMPAITKASQPDPDFLHIARDAADAADAMLIVYVSRHRQEFRIDSDEYLEGTKKREQTAPLSPADL